jgi:hypothetical protein
VSNLDLRLYCIINGKRRQLFNTTRLDEMGKNKPLLQDDLGILSTLSVNYAESSLDSSECLVQVCNVKYMLDRVNRRDGYSMKKVFRSSARGASLHTKYASNANVVRAVLLDANS